MNGKPILLATDGSPSAAEATLQAIELARALDTRLIVVSVDHVSTFGGAGAFYGYADVLAELKHLEHGRIEKALEQAAAAAAESGVECETVHAGDEATVADQICRLATARKVRLIVIGTHGWNAVTRLLHGSVSTAVVHESRCPVLVVPSGVDADEHPLDDLANAVRTREPVA